MYSHMPYLPNRATIAMVWVDAAVGSMGQWGPMAAVRSDGSHYSVSSGLPSASLVG